MIERYHPDFAADLLDPCRYFDGIDTRLGNRFRASINDALDAVIERPESFGCVERDYRVAILRGFPYVIVFKMYPSVVGILSLRHAASDRSGWFDRTLPHASG